MPLSELLRLATGELESSQQGSFRTAPVENDLVELVWENGQIMMQTQSSRGTETRSLAPNSLPCNTNRDAAIGHPTFTRNDKFGRVESILNHMSPVVPSGELDLSQDDEIVPWLSYPITDALPQDYIADLLPEISSVTATGTSTQNSFVSVDRRSSCDQTLSNLHNGGNTFKASTSKASSWMLQHRQTSDALDSGCSDIISNSDMTSHPGAVFGNAIHGKDRVYGSTSVKMERPALAQPTNNLNLLNFPQFSRPATLIKTSLPDTEKVPMSVLSRVESLEVKEKGLGASASSSKPPKFIVVDRSNIAQEDIAFHVPSSKLAREPMVKAPKESCPPERTEKLSKNPCVKNGGPVIPINTPKPMKEVPLSDRTVETVVASSSVGSGHSADRVSYEQSQNRKFHEIEDSECPSDDIETVSNGIKKTTPPQVGNGSKRSRAAEVHNLSERRRRDRINEKMRALQELIPNCNRVDKASMLDEAIEYLKTLQLQVQIMSMGAGLYMPSPVMFPPGIRHMRPTHVPQFSPIGVGMGMGMLDMSGGAPGCPVFPVPPIQVPYFPSPMSGPVNFPTIPAYGHPSPGFPNLIPRAPLVPPVTSARDLSGLKSGNHNEIPSSSTTLHCGDHITKTNSHSMFDAEASSSKHHKADQIQATNVADDQPKGHGNKEARDAMASAPVTSTTGTDNRKRKGHY